MKDCDFLFTPSVLENAPGNVTNEVAAMTFNELPRIPQRLASKQPGFRFRGMECRSSGVSIIVVIITIMMLVINISILLVVVVVVVVVVEGGGRGGEEVVAVVDVAVEEAAAVPALALYLMMPEKMR